MIRQFFLHAFLWVAAVVGGASGVLAAGHGGIDFIRTPNGGIQPQTAIDTEGTVHLVYFKGEAGGGDLFYVRRMKSGSFSKPIQVNSQPGSAIATGTIRGAQVCLGKGGRVHVVWNGGKGSRADGHEGAPLLYSRLNDPGTGFEAEQDMISMFGLDGGSAIAANSSGHVFVAWHAPRPGTTKGEMGRAVFLRESSDEGKTFSAAREISPDWGTCGCCGMRAFAEDSGRLTILYRAATDAIHRDEVLLVSNDEGRHFDAKRIGLWQTGACPMSSAWIGSSFGQTIAAWETAGQVFFMPVSAQKPQSGAVTSPPGSGERKHPVAAVNSKGQLLFAWTEGTGWQRGGKVAWQLFDEAGNPLPEHGTRPGVPEWSFVSAFAEPDGHFVVVY